MYGGYDWDRRRAGFLSKSSGFVSACFLLSAVELVLSVPFRDIALLCTKED